MTSQSSHMNTKECKAKQRKQIKFKLTLYFSILLIKVVESYLTLNYYVL